MIHLLWLFPAYVAYGAVLWCTTWILFLAGMNIQSVEPLLYGQPAKLAVPVKYLAGHSSTLLNYTVLTAILWEKPQEKYASARFLRHKHFGTGRRQKFCTYVVDNWLAPFDTSGGHT